MTYSGLHGRRMRVTSERHHSLIYLRLGERLCHKVIDRSERLFILRNGPSAPNGGRSSVRMGVEFDDTQTAAGHPSG